MGNLGYGAYPTHPGEVLKDEIEERGISQRQLADSMGLTYSVVNEILNAHRPLTAKTALMFEAALDVPADSLMYLQTKYNLQVARKDPALFSLLKEIKKSSSNILTPLKIAKHLDFKSWRFLYVYVSRETSLRFCITSPPRFTLK